MNLYLDSAYVAKCYLNDPDAAQVRKLVRGAESIHSSALCIAEVACAFHRRIREGALTRRQGTTLRQLFLEHVSRGVWVVAPVTDAVLRGVDASIDLLPKHVLLRAGDAIHLASAKMGGFSEIWSNDRRLLLAAPFFGLTGRSVQDSRRASSDAPRK